MTLTKSGDFERRLWGRCAAWARENVAREFPFAFGHIFREERPARPSAIHPVFGAAYDWHSCVHSFWLLLRSARFASAPFDRTEAEAEGVESVFLDRFSPEACETELAFLRAHPRFESPYGLAWLTELGAEIETNPVLSAKGREQIGAALDPLLEEARALLTHHFERLGRPNRTGEHRQTAFSLSLFYRALERIGRASRLAEVWQRVPTLFDPQAVPSWRCEPFGFDFLSPALAEGDLLASRLEPNAFEEWYDRVLGPEFPDRYTPVAPVDRSDGKFAHYDGLNASRSAMLYRIAGAGLSRDLSERLRICAEDHFEAACDALEAEEYEVTHWVGSFIALAWESRKIVLSGN